MNLSESHKFLIAKYWKKNDFFKKKRWQKAYEQVMATNTPLETILHGYKAIIPSNYQYPFFVRQFPKYNNPIIEIVYQQHKALNRQVNFVDVGTAVADTVLLVMANCPSMINNILCIDGDDEFINFAKKNITQFKNSKAVQYLLSDSATEIAGLVRHHQNSASALGEAKVAALPLDNVCQIENFNTVDVLKIDVDGFDGKVLAGSTQILYNNQPIVIFEWHPKLYNNTNNSFYLPFQVLSNNGYNKFVWFNKFGDYSHFVLGNCTEAYLDLQAKICLDATFDSDWHYDVVAIHQDSKIDIAQLADSNYSRNKKVPH
jgi:FkbM family methyltransferase